MHPGDSLFVYTDGVPEAADSSEGMFGEERLTDVLNRYADAEPKELIGHVHDAIYRFMGSAEQFDDITMLCLRYYGAQDPEKP